MDSHIATADAELHAAIQSSAELSDLLDAAIPPVGGPVASFTYEPGPPNYPRQLIYTGAPASCVQFDWQWGDGTSESHPFTTTKKTFPADGTYVTTLTVTDAAGLQNTTSQSV